MSINVISEIGYCLNRLDTIVKRLKAELFKSSLNKDEIHRLLAECKGDLDRLAVLAKYYNDASFLNQFFKLSAVGQKAHEQIDFKTFFEELLNLPKINVDEVSSLSSYLETLLILFTHAFSKLGDEYYREKLYALIPKIESLIERISIASGRSIGARLGAILGLTSTWGLGENWATSIIYLQALEIAINKTLERLNVKAEGGFKDKFKKLVEEINDPKFLELEKILPAPFWDLRNKVVHEGYEPSNEELDTIVEWTSRILEKLRTI
ncbi:MAG: hypothetical protein QW612_05635 [Candidatus Bathyarchaeia archaeon]